jgi:hypothetical protein
MAIQRCAPSAVRSIPQTHFSKESSIELSPPALANFAARVARLMYIAGATQPDLAYSASAAGVDMK